MSKIIQCLKDKTDEKWYKRQISQMERNYDIMLDNNVQDKRINDK